MANSNRKDPLKVVATVAFGGVQVDIVEDFIEGRSLPFYKASSPYRPYVFQGEEQRGRLLSKNEIILGGYTLALAYLRICEIEEQERQKSNKKSDAGDAE